MLSVEGMHIAEEEVKSGPGTAGKPLRGGHVQVRRTYAAGVIAKLIENRGAILKIDQGAWRRGHVFSHPKIEIGECRILENSEIKRTAWAESSG
jgi:hypothetical protein